MSSFRGAQPGPLGKASHDERRRVKTDLSGALWERPTRGAAQRVHALTRTPAATAAPFADTRRTANPAPSIEERHGLPS
jgi:hypothetical protein